jgi:hypothetical protein
MLESARKPEFDKYAGVCYYSFLLFFGVLFFLFFDNKIVRPLFLVRKVHFKFI